MEFNFGLKYHFAHFQENPRELPLYVCIRGVQQKCVNMYYVMHITGGSQKIKQEKHMLYLPKSDSPVWESGSSSFVSKTTKTETFG
jgi:hypothetical protein